MYNNNTNNTWFFLTKTKRMVLQRRKVRKYYWFIIYLESESLSEILILKILFITQQTFEALQLCLGLYIIRFYIVFIRSVNGTKQEKQNFKKKEEKKNNFFSGNKNVQQIRQKQKIALCIKLNESAVSHYNIKGGV